MRARRRRPIRSLLIGLVALLCAACGGESTDDTTPGTTPDQAQDGARGGSTTRRRSVKDPRPGAPRSLADVVGTVDANLAGMRGEVARGCAEMLLEQVLPEDAAGCRALVLEALETGNATVRWVALIAVPTAGPIDDALLRAILKQTGPHAAHMNVAVHEALKNAEGVDDAAANRMWRVAESAQPPLRAALYYALGIHRPQALRREVLRAALGDETVGVRRSAAFALLRSLPVDAPVPAADRTLVPEFMAAAQDDDEAVRAYAVFGLTRFGAHAASAARVLTDRLSDDSGRVRTGATSALVAIGDPAVPVIGAQLDSGDHARTEAAAYILRHIGTPAALSALRAGLGSEDPYVRGRSAMALRALKTPGLDALAIYASLLKEEDADAVLLGLEGLGQMGADAASVIDGVRPLVRHADPRVRRAATVWLEFLDRR